MAKKEVNIVKYNKYKHYGSGVYGLGFIGAVIYYLQLATGFWDGVLGIIKALFWPAFLVYKLLGL
jgi:hypothetical protein